MKKIFLTLAICAVLPVYGRHDDYMKKYCEMRSEYLSEELSNWNENECHKNWMGYFFILGQINAFDEVSLISQEWDD